MGWCMCVVLLSLGRGCDRARRRCASTRRGGTVGRRRPGWTKDLAEATSSVSRRSGLRLLRELVLDRPELRLRARRQAELAQDVRDVRPGGALRDEQLRTDVLVGEALAEEAHHVLLAVGERLDRLGLLLGAHPLREQSG